MKICGIIAEYNPLHEGHAYQMKEAKRLSGADALLTIQSGYFVERGEPAVFDPFIRAKDAIINGSDAVFMMPPEASTSSAEGFARYGVCLLDKLGCDYISCGVEPDTKIDKLKELARQMVLEDGSLSSKIKEAMKSGLTYPKALTNALGIDQLSPNALLCLEYLKAIEAIGSKMELIPVIRKGEGYHETASVLREKIWKDTTAKCITPDDLLTMIIDAVRIHDLEGSLTDYLDCDNAIANRLHNSKLNYTSFDEMVKDIKTKDVTYTRVARVLMHILLSIKQATDPKIAHLIAFCDNGVLGEVKERTQIPIVSKAADYKNELSSSEYAARVYNQAYFNKYHEEKPEFFRTNIVKVDKAVRPDL